MNYITSLITINKPEWYAKAENNGAVGQLINERYTILGYVPYQRARQVATICFVTALLLHTTNLPKSSDAITVGCIASCVAGYLYIRFQNEKMRIDEIIKENSVFGKNG